ncbi:MAG TPA: choice-of-anchor D domain-containing protein [Bryobacteraceae bacterium]|nr:choice-of-anchor D domain-containing protein [Bryobacteraceae bacterium]
MYRLAFLIAALAPLAAFAQLQVYEFDGTTDTPLSPLTSIGPTAPGGTVETRFHIRNLGTGAVSLNTLTVSGAAFTFASAPSLPYLLSPYTGPASQLEFDVNFSPEITGTFGAFLDVDSLNFALQGISSLAATLTIAGSDTPLTAGAPVDFGAVAVGSSRTFRFTLNNPGSTSLSVKSVAVTGAGFSGPLGLSTPVQLSSGQLASFQVIFIPQSAAPYQGTLSVDGQTFPLTGQGLNSAPELQLFEFDGNSDTPVANRSVVNVGTVAPGDKVTARFHLRNTGHAAVVLQKPAFSGAAFAIQSAPAFPYTLSPYAGPSSEPEIDVAFHPATVGHYTATLAISDLSIDLQGVAAVTADLTVANGSTPLASGTSINFGPVDVGSSAKQTLVLSNSIGASILVSNVSVTGTAFSMVPGLILPIQINPSQKVSFQVAFAPQAGIPYKGTLAVDGRTFPLTGTGLAAALPTASLVFGPGTVASGQTNNISIPLAEASQTAGNGTLALSFQPGVAGATQANDPAIQFFPAPAYRETITIDKGAATALIDGQASMQFQTGTTAGTITFTLTIEDHPPQQTTLTIPPAPVMLDDVTAVRLPGEIDVAVQGFDNTYSASGLQFTFFDLKNNALPGGIVSTDASSEFRPYFSTTQYGGMFRLLLKFPVSGDTAEIGSVSLGITNSVGTTTTTQPVAVTN